MKLPCIFFAFLLVFLIHFLWAEPLKTELQHLSLQEIKCLPSHILQKGGGNHAEVLLIQSETKTFVLKNYDATEGWFHFFLSKFLTSREARALEQLKELKGVQKLIRKVNERALLLEYVPGEKARLVNKGEITPEFFEEFYLLVDQMHQHGIAHCDLLSKGNVILGEDGRPYIIDFATFFSSKEPRNRLKGWIFETLCKVDRVSVARIKERHFPELLTETEKQNIIDNREQFINRVGRNISIAFRRLGKRSHSSKKHHNNVEERIVAI